MKTGLFYHKACLDHITPSGHPESAQRLESVLKRLLTPKFSKLAKFSAPLAKKNDILLVHSNSYFNTIKKSNSLAKITKIDNDTYISSGSFNAARRCVGAITKAIDLILEGKITNAFCATRPPGHHAEKSYAMGFCLFNNIAIGAQYALKKKGLKKVAVIDFDVHHGNGTQNVLWKEKNALYISIHQSSLFPGTGFSNETGISNNILNFPVNVNFTGKDLSNLLKQNILKKLTAFRPDLLLISTGFDAHKHDPLGGLNWQTDDFSMATKMLKEFANKTCNGRLVSSLEGGYNISSLTDCCEQHIIALME